MNAKEYEKYFDVKFYKNNLKNDLEELYDDREFCVSEIKNRELISFSTIDNHEFLQDIQNKLLLLDNQIFELETINTFSRIIVDEEYSDYKSDFLEILRSAKLPYAKFVNFCYEKLFGEPVYFVNKHIDNIVQMTAILENFADYYEEWEKNLK